MSNAQIMSEAAEKAAQAAHAVIGSILDSDERMDDHRKIGAAITAATGLYAGMIKLFAEDTSEEAAAIQQLILGTFNTLISEPLASIAIIRAKAEAEKKKP